MKALEDAGYNSKTVAFKAPNPGMHWLSRFFTKGTPERNELVFWDRGPAGDAVYGGHKEKML